MPNPTTPAPVDEMPLPEPRRSFLCTYCGHTETTKAKLGEYPGCPKCTYAGFVVTDGRYSEDELRTRDAQWSAQVQALRAEVEAMRYENTQLRVGLRFYANQQHYMLDDDEDFDTVSGEPQNWLCSGREESGTMIEDGEVARFTLMGEPINWIDGDDDNTPPQIAGERAAIDSALQSSEQAGAKEGR